MPLWSSLALATAPGPADEYIILQGGVFRRITDALLIGNPAQIAFANVFTVSPQTVVCDADAHAGIVVKGHSPTQSANLQEWQISTGAKPFVVGPTGGPTLANGVVLGFADTGGNANGVVRMDGASNLGVNHFGAAGNLNVGISNGASIGNVNLSTQNKVRIEVLFNGIVAVNRLGNANPGLNTFLVYGSAAQAVNIQEWRSSAGATLSAIGPNGAYLPAAMADASAPVSSLYFSTTANKLVYKDGLGVVNPLY